MQLKSQTMNITKSQSGFSLVELMVVVGIIGLLAAIAVPQFSKFQARARQAEAKTMLSAIFTAEKAFNAEWNAYVHSMTVAGVAMTGNKLRYDGQVSAVAAVCAGYPAAAPAAAAVVTVIAATTASGGGSLDPLVTATPTAVTAPAVCTATTFTASVVGDPKNVPVTPFNTDQWTINETKAITNPASGI